MVLRVELSDERGNRLRRLMQKTRDVVVLRRCKVVMQSAQRYTPPRIAELMNLHVDYVREIVNQYVAIDRIRENLGWRPTVAIEEGIRSTYPWYAEYFGARPGNIPIAPAEAGR